MYFVLRNDKEIKLKKIQYTAVFTLQNVSEVQKFVFHDFIMKRTKIFFYIQYI